MTYAVSFDVRVALDLLSILFVIAVAFIVR